VASEATILALRTDLPYKSIDDLRKAKQPIHLASVGPTAKDYQFPTLLKEFLELNLKIVTYRSGSESRLAMEQKEVDGKAGSYSSLKAYIDRGFLRPFVRGRTSAPGIEDLPVNEDLCLDEMGKKLMAILSAVDIVGRPYIAPPGTPAKMMTILRGAFDKVAKDPEALKDAKKMNKVLKYVSGEECLKIYDDVFIQPSNIIKNFAKYIKF
jgi:tripartite-type tricarboxylate transporter receptor subunit TctC